MPKHADTTRRRTDWWPPLVIFAAACAFCWPVFLGRIMSPADMCLLMLPWKALTPHFPGFVAPHNPLLDPIQQYLPWRIYAVESLRAGVVPLWNPYSFCGTPFLANLQSTLLYPLNLLFLLTGARHGFGLSAILHLTLGGVFMFALLRDFRLRQAAALLGALVFMFNGYTVTWLEYPTLSLWVFMWLPAILFCYRRSLRTPVSLWPVFCALAIGFQFLGGHFQVSAYLLIALLALALTTVLEKGASWPRRRTAVLAAFIPLALGLLLAAAQILPTLELAGHTGRVSHGLKETLSSAFPITHFILYLVPNFFGNPVHYNYWGSFRDPGTINFLETACYVGVLPIFLAGWSVRRRRDPAFAFFLALTAFAVLAAIGSPIYYALYYAAPGFKGLAGLGRILSLAAFGLAGLAALGCDDLLDLKLRSPARLPLLSAIVAAAAIIAAWVAFRPLALAVQSEHPFPAYLARQVFIALALVAGAAVLIAARARLRLSAAAFTTLALALLVVDLFGFGLSFNPYTDARTAYPDTATTRWLQQHARDQRVTSLASDGLDWMAHNSSMIFHLRDIHGSDSLRVRRSFELVSPPDGNQAHYPDPDSPLLDALGVKYLVTNRELSGKWWWVGEGEANIYENANAIPRLRAVGQVVAAGVGEDLTALQQEAAPFRRRALASPETVAALRSHHALPSEAMPPSRVQVLLDEPDAMQIAVKGEGSSLLVITDSFYPGWRARVDGRSAPIYRVDYGFRGVPVPAGDHTVELRYEPDSYRVGLFLSLLAAMALAAAFGYCRTRSSADRTASRS